MDPARLVEGFGHFPETAGYILSAYRRGIHDRCSAGVPYRLRGVVPDPAPRRERMKPTRHARRRLDEVNRRAVCAWCESPADPRFGLATVNGRGCFCSSDCRRQHAGW